MELHFDAKLIAVAALFALLMLVKFLAGSKPWDTPVRRRRRFGYRGELGPLRNPAASAADEQPRAPAQAREPARDPEKEFFGEP